MVNNASVFGARGEQNDRSKCNAGAIEGVRSRCEERKKLSTIINLSRLEFMVIIQKLNIIKGCKISSTNPLLYTCCFLLVEGWLAAYAVK